MKKQFNYTDMQRQWLDFMKTTDLPQGKEMLFCDAGYCCLGLACKIFDWGFAGRWGDGGELTQQQADALQLRNTIGSSSYEFIIGGVQYTSLANANDEDVPFDIIAEAIEADPENFFTNNDEDSADV